MDVSAPASFEWDEWNFQGYFYYCVTEELKKYQKLTPNANLALMLAICEWVEHKFSGLSDDPVPLEYIAAGWGAILDPDNSRWFQIVDDEWMGPIRAPLMAVIGIVNEAFYESGDNPDKAYRTCYALNLARHVLPNGSRFPSWLSGAEDRLFSHHLAADDPEMQDDLFEDDFPRGRIVPRDLFDLSSEYIPEGAGEQLIRFVQSVEVSGNRFLTLGGGA